MNEAQRYRSAITGSLDLLKLGKEQEALKLLDDAIAVAIQKGDRSSVVCTLCHHGAVLCHMSGNLSHAKRYYEQSLRSIPENPMALFGLARVALDQGDAITARQYAKRSYDATVSGDDEIAKRGLLDMIAKHWPDIAAE